MRQDRNLVRISDYLPDLKPVIHYSDLRKNSLLKYKLFTLKLNFSKLKEIEKFESEIRQLEKNPKELLDAWREYIQHELKLNDPGMLA